MTSLRSGKRDRKMMMHHLYSRPDHDWDVLIIVINMTDETLFKWGEAVSKSISDFDLFVPTVPFQRDEPRKS